MDQRLGRSIQNRKKNTSLQFNLRIFSCADIVAAIIFHVRKRMKRKPLLVGVVLSFLLSQRIYNCVSEVLQLLSIF